MSYYYQPPPPPEPPKRSPAGKVILIVFGVIFGLVILGELGGHQDTNYHGSVSSFGATDTPTTTVHKAQGGPVTVTGSGEQVVTAKLDEGAYLLNYRDSDSSIIVAPVNEDGSEGSSIVNEFKMGAGALDGSTTFHSNGVTTFRVRNTQGDWTLTFTPMN